MTTGAIRRAKLQSNHHHQKTNTQFFTGRMSFLSPNQHKQTGPITIHCTAVSVQCIEMKQSETRASVAVSLAVSSSSDAAAVRHQMHLNVFSLQTLSFAHVNTEITS